MNSRKDVEIYFTDGTRVDVTDVYNDSIVEGCLFLNSKKDYVFPLRSIKYVVSTDQES